MTKTEIQVKDFKINYLSQEQYDREKAAGRINENEIYMTPVGEVYLPINPAGHDALTSEQQQAILNYLGASASNHTHEEYDTTAFNKIAIENTTDEGTTLSNIEAILTEDGFTLRNGDYINLSTDENNIITISAIKPSLEDLGAAASNHNHDGVYSPIGHTHDEFNDLENQNAFSQIALKNKNNASIGAVSATNATDSFELKSNGFISLSKEGDSTVVIGTQSITAADIGAAPSDHNHDDKYSEKGHEHPEYITTGFNSISIEGVTDAITAKSSSDGFGIKKSGLITLGKDGDSIVIGTQEITPSSIGAAPSNHNHDDKYAEKDHDHGVNSFSTVKIDNNNIISTTTINDTLAMAPNNNDHITMKVENNTLVIGTDITGPESIGAAAANHNHDNKYATKEHSHDEFSRPAFKTIKVNTTSIDPQTSDDTFAIESDGFITLTPNASNHSVKISTRNISAEDINAAKKDHNHNGVYSPIGHTHEDYINQNAFSTISIKDDNETNPVNTSINAANATDSFEIKAGTRVSLSVDGKAVTINSNLPNLEDLGLNNAMHFIGVATVAITDGSTTNPTISGYDFSKKQAGDVIIDKDSKREYVWSSAGKWELLGTDDNYKIVQTAKSDPSASGTAITFISTISQNANGEITATKKTVQDASKTQSGVVSTGAQSFTGEKTFEETAHYNARLDVKGTNDSTNSTDTNASIYTAGGVSVKQQISAKTVRIDNNQTTKGCIMVFNETQNCLEFTFQ